MKSKVVTGGFVPFGKFYSPSLLKIFHNVAQICKCFYVSFSCPMTAKRTMFNVSDSQNTFNPLLFFAQQPITTPRLTSGLARGPTVIKTGNPNPVT